MQIQPQSREQQIIFASIDDYVEKENPVRILEYFIRTIIQKDPQKYAYKGQSKLGRPAYQSETMLKIYVYGYINRITSSRRLETESKRNLELIWLTGNLHPDFKTIADYRKDNKEIIKEFCKDVKNFLKDNHLLLLQEVAIDGTKLKANARREMLNRNRIIQQLESLEIELEEYLLQMEESDKRETTEGGSEELKAKDIQIANLEQKIEELNAKLDKMTRNKHKYLSKTDEDCRLMRTGEGMQPAYNIQISSETKHHFIIGEYVSQSGNDMEELAKAVEEIKSETGETPGTILADTGYGNPDMIQAIETEQGTECIIPLAKEQGRRGEITFEYDAENDRYICSQGEYLTLRHKEKAAKKSFVDVYVGENCTNCPLKENCTRSSKGRHISRFWNQAYRQKHRTKMETTEARTLIRKRKTVIEHIMGTMKVWMGKIPILTRGRANVTSEIKLFSASYNIKRLMSMFSFDELMEMIKNYVKTGLNSTILSLKTQKTNKITLTHQISSY